MIRTPVLVVGGGPVGSTLALDLASRGIDVVVAERNPPGQIPGVKCNHVAARTMEIFRRLGVAQIVRDTGLPADHANDIAFRTSATGVEFGRIMIPCRRDRYTNKDGPDGYWPTPEPPHRINQIYLDPLLAGLARDHNRVRYINRLEVEGFTQSDDGVTAEAVDHVTGERAIIQCDYLIGCDGPSSNIRHLIDARLTGDAFIGRTQSTYVRAPGLAERMQAPRAWSTQVMNPRRSANMFAVDGRETWLIHNYLRDSETDFAAIDPDWCIRTIMGVDADFAYDVITRENWIGRRLLADRFRDRRAFICGDAAHLWVPSAGFGMNAGIADAMNLSWMLAGVLHGWADPNILAAHEAERWPITEQVSKFAMSTSLSVARTRAEVPDDIEYNTATQSEFGQAMQKMHTPQFCCGGLNFGYFYDRSPIIQYDGEAAPSYTMDQFMPATVPGCRTPHIWLSGGESLYDAIGPDFSLIRFDRSVEVGGLVDAAAHRRLPLRVIDVAPAEVYRHKLLLSRPDQHVAWRGDAVPDNPRSLVDKIRGAA
ncbi:MAG TPA: FAD-dependent monooxygenase [Acetobacteraceae bacterium]|nr:FAD-dependent monooxygenase [Acetobacteraceae bacterium]